MKQLALLIALIYSSLTIAAPPLGISGQEQSNKYPAVHKVPNYQLTDIGSSQGLIETGNPNILANPSFEHSTFSTSWTLTAGTAAEELSIVRHGKKAFKVSLSAQALELYQDSTLYAGQSNDNGMAFAKVKTSVAGIFVCSRNAGVTNYNNCTPGSSANTYDSLRAPFVLGATSNGIAIVSGTLASGVVTPGNVTGDVYVDDAFVGAANITDTQPTIGPWKTETGFTVNGLGTISNASWKYRQVGDSYQVSGYFAHGTVAASTTYIQLPSSWTIDLTKTAGTGNHNWVGWSQRFGSETMGATTRYPLFTDGATNNQIFFAIATGTAANGFNKINGSSLTASNLGFTIEFTVPISQLSGSTNTYTAPCGANCVDTFSAKVSAAGVVSAENVDFVTGNASISATSTYTLTVTGFSTTPNCTCTPVRDTECSYDYAVSSATSLVFKEDSSAGAVQAQDFSFICQKQGADFTASRAIHGSFKQFANVAYIAGTKANGTDAGASAAGNQTRELTTIISDPNGIVTSLSGNQFTLPAGKYFIEASAPAHSCRHKLKVRNITAGSTVVLNGTTIFAGSNVTTPSIASGVVTITTPSAFDLYHYTSTIVASDGLGVDSSGSGEVEVYSTVKITRLD